VTEKKLVRVSDVMELDYAIVEGVATVAEALAIMREKNAHFVIVAKRHEDDEYGMVLGTVHDSSIASASPRLR
jgi:CBS domain-containing protein